MIDTQSIRAAVDLLRLVENDTALKRVANTGGGEYAGACPFCGGRDRFRVQPEARRWLCRACTNGAWQDAIEYVKRREHCDFRAACEILGGMLSIDKPGSHSMRDETRTNTDTAPRVNAIWQNRARVFVETSAAALWRDNGTKARAWLNARGLHDDTLRAWYIGYNTADRWEAADVWGLPEERDANARAKRVWLPRGIVIPCAMGDTLPYVKVRRATDDPKYYKLRGSQVGLFGAANFLHDQLVASAANAEADQLDRRAAVLCEGELDALLLWQHAKDLAAIGTLGSASDKPRGGAWARYLLPYAVWLLAYDLDAAGERGADTWREFSARTRRATPPRVREGDKDVTDFWKSGGDLRAWLAFELTRHTGRSLSDISAHSADFGITLKNELKNEKSNGTPDAPMVGAGELAGFFGYAAPFVSKGIWKKRGGVYWHKPGARFLGVSAHVTAESIGTW